VCWSVLYFVTVRCRPLFLLPVLTNRLDYGPRSCCSVVQCVAGCCRVLQCGAVRCSVVHYAGVCVAVCCGALRCVAVCCSVLQCVACPSRHANSQDSTPYSSFTTIVVARWISRISNCCDIELITSKLSKVSTIAISQMQIHENSLWICNAIVYRTGHRNFSKGCSVVIVYSKCRLLRIHTIRQERVTVLFEKAS